MSSCLHCHANFTITAEDKKLLDEVSPVFNNKKYLIPEPTFCPDCRAQRRMSWRNERHFHKRKCDKCQKPILSMYKADTPFPVYCLDCWWSDNWEPMREGRSFDFTRPFFEQFFELRDKTPHFALANLKSTMENADFCNHAGYLKNCYLIVNSDQSEQCMYGKGINRCFNCLDSFKIYDCQACYECINCNNCAFSTFLVDSYTCDSCHFSANLMGCKNCFGCVNLRNKEYHFLNKPHSKEEYEQKVSEIKKNRSLSELWNQFQEFRNKLPFKAMQEKNTENCTGEYLVNSKNCSHCFDAEYLEECRYCNDLKKSDKVSYKNMDISYFGMGVDYSYECSVAGYNANHTLFCENVWECNDVLYSQLCVNNCHDLFGCIGLKHAQYCILNKQYSKAEYEKSAARIIDHMNKTKEYGEFFATKDSGFGYNETTSFEYFSLSENEVIKNNWHWQEEPELDTSTPAQKILAKDLPRNIADINDDILNCAIVCAESGRPFKIQAAELNFYRQMNLPVPQFHPDIRHLHRLTLRRPRKLYDRNCSNCSEKITSSFAPDGKAKVYCEKCYQKTVY